MRLSIVIAATIVAACAVGAASAATSVDRTFKATSQDCREVQWSADILRDYPDIGAACQSVERRDGKTFVKFQGTVETVSKDGRELKVKFKDGETLTLAPTQSTVLYMGGDETPIAKLYRGAKLNFYVPEDRLAAQFFSDDPVKSVEVPIVREQSAAGEASQLEESEERQTVAARELPATGSSLPLVGWAAVLLIMVGSAVTVCRMLMNDRRSHSVEHAVKGPFPHAR